MALRDDLDSRYSDPLSRASARREPAANVTHAHAQDPRALAVKELGAGDRALADARRRMLDLSAPKPAAPAQSSSATWARMPVFAAPVRQAAPVQTKPAAHQPGFIPLPVSAERRAEYARMQEANERAERGEE